MVNKVYLVEKFVYKIIHEKYDPTEEEVKAIGEILGQPTKKLAVVFDRYKYVFNRYVEKRCIQVDNTSLCIYTWNQRVPFRVFPLSLHLVGTILLFKDGEPIEVLAYPMPKVLSYVKTSEVSESKYGLTIPREVTKRIDGWQVTAYYNTVLNRWIFATRYALHNMYFEKGKLIVESFDSIANPFVYIADKIAQEENLYNIIDRFRGWTFTFVLEGPEPAITKPPYPLGGDYRRYKLYVLMARDPEGRLYTWRETTNILKYRGPEPVEPKPLRDLYRDIVRKLDIRSYIAYIDTNDIENPLLVELESEVYPDAMNVKYLYDAKSAALLVTEDLVHELIHMVEPSIAENINIIIQSIEKLKTMLNNIDREKIASASWEIVRTLNEFREDIDIRVEEVLKALGEKNINRIVRKLVSLLLEGRSIVSKETINILTSFAKKLEQRLTSI